MACPLYNDYTRECVEQFEVIVNFITFDVCESDEEYPHCVIYRAIKEHKPICPVLKECSRNIQKVSTKLLLKLMRKDDIIEKLSLDEYCFSTNFKNCARYKLLINGEKAPTSLRPDGSHVKIKEFLSQSV